MKRKFSDVVRGFFTQTGEFIITGYKLKVAGDDSSIGVYFKNTANGTLNKAHSLAENGSSKLIGIFPGIPAATYQIIIKTQYSGSGGKFLKEVRTIESNFTIAK